MRAQIKMIKRTVGEQVTCRPALSSLSERHSAVRASIMLLCSFISSSILFLPCTSFCTSSSFWIRKWYIQQKKSINDHTAYWVLICFLTRLRWLTMRPRVPTRATEKPVRPRPCWSSGCPDGPKSSCGSKEPSSVSTWSSMSCSISRLDWLALWELKPEASGERLLVVLKDLLLPPERQLTVMRLFKWTCKYRNFRSGHPGQADCAFKIQVLLKMFTKPFFFF